MLFTLSLLLNVCGLKLELTLVPWELELGLNLELAGPNYIAVYNTASAK